MAEETEKKLPEKTIIINGEKVTVRYMERKNIIPYVMIGVLVFSIANAIVAYLIFDIYPYYPIFAALLFALMIVSLFYINSRLSKKKSHCPECSGDMQRMMPNKAGDSVHYYCPSCKLIVDTKEVKIK